MPKTALIDQRIVPQSGEGRRWWQVGPTSVSVHSFHMIDMQIVEWDHIHSAAYIS